uniref:J domain-containing protein n=1 Tax=Chromera velia CCMP2878 TaxID=1169474 RepID=A0A0G4HSR6_9ALVE|eukprot:Cvel_8339.t1-p1 / transcript=Cvel_8339.t1 / gene=Cvel_8339 / organism=Chromera_velia_CCMP2878 / gene_product=Chaperone protein DnaJ, putative / transcript_product=Chaperone protein DnaJ, putative / location=Cvel_scaffold459:9409-13789(+) / protein_length=532 / sequence_SO=supercontig / SO=protein_coding / is_pseudo=false
MKCVSDEPWICAGDDDHVSSQTPVPGKYRGKGKCPSGEAVEEATRKRREAAENRRQEKEAAAREAEEEKAKLKAKRSEADPSPKCSSDEKRESEEKSAEEIARHLKKLKLRSRLHDEVPDRGSVEPYDVLEVSVTSTPSEVRKAYRKLSLLFHPDKNRGNEESRKMADAAFSDIQNAFDLLGTPDKRTAFDEASTFSKNAGDAARFAQDKKNWRGDEEFYMGDPLISTLTEGIWERRMHGDGIWFIECYAAWCPHCVSRGAWSLCFSDFPHVQQVSAEWRHLLASRDVEMLDTSHFLFNLPALVEEEKERKAQREADIEAGDEMEEEEEEAEKEHAERQNFHMVLFFDSLECGPCKVGMTNLRRLAASLRGLPVSIGAVNCEASEELHSLCYETLQLSAPPHRPHLRAWPAGTIEEKAHRPEGTELYNPNELEPHIVLRTLEKTLRLALADRREAGQKTGSALVAGKPSDFEDEKEEEEEEEPPPPPPEAPPDMSWHDFADTLMWDGPEQPALPPTPWKVYARPRAPAIATA